MILSAQNLRSIGWLALLAVCGALVMILSFRVNAVRSKVHHADAQIVALKQQKMYLETEFETRANQQQLKAWNDLEFGYVAPIAGQYLENERQLAVLSKPAEPDAPAPIRVATVDDSVIAAAAFPGIAAGARQLSDTHEGEPEVRETRRADATAEDAGPGVPARPVDHAAATATLAEKLGTLHAAGTRKAAAPEKTVSKAGDKKAAKTKPGDKTKSAAAAKPATGGKATKAATRVASAAAHGDAKTGAKKSR
ncbi:hypothetical protein [Novosphingobium sp.]|uniref:hypothetical protein n=1 Tax=Novosphingobium sp. TaxID=1874826 RepID=UPI002FDE01F6